MEFTIVKAVPFNSGIACWATKVENIGESATTVTPHMINTLKKMKGEDIPKMRGDARQQKPDIAKLRLAIIEGWYFKLKKPVRKQPTPPTAMMVKLQKGTFNDIPILVSLKYFRIKGTKA